jgi:hypothetical protein
MHYVCWRYRTSDAIYISTRRTTAFYRQAGITGQPSNTLSKEVHLRKADTCCGRSVTLRRRQPHGLYGTVDESIVDRFSPESYIDQRVGGSETRQLADIFRLFPRCPDRCLAFEHWIYSQKCWYVQYQQAPWGAYDALPRRAIVNRRRAAER